MYTNKTDIPLSMALWLVSDDYDYNNDPYTISATTFLKPLRSLILSNRIKGETSVDLSTMINMRMGTAVHDAIEKAWNMPEVKRNACLEKLGVPKSVQKRIVINPSVIEDWMIPVFMENRATKKVGKWTISGKYDFVMDSTVEDFKTTGSYSYITGSNIVKWRLQASIYRWLNVDKIKNDYMMLSYLFTDWSKLAALKSKDYPQNRIISEKLPLLTLEETEKWITNRLAHLEQLKDEPQSNLPRCTQEELWQDPPKFKYFKDPSKAVAGQRSTRTVNSMEEATAIQQKYGGVGTIVPTYSKAKFCEYCNGKSICSQAEELEAAGLLNI